MFNYDWNWSIFLPHWKALLLGVWITIKLSALAALLGTIAGLIGAVALRRIRYRTLRGALFLANDAMRAIPVILLLFVAYYFPYKSVGIDPLSPFGASLLALALSQAAFSLDLYYWAFERINSRTIEAAESLGITRQTTFWCFTLPDIMRQTAPAMTAFVIGLVKLSSFASVIGCPDLVYVAGTIGASQHRSIEPWILAACVYIVVVTPAAILGRHWENSPWMRRR